MTHTDLVDYVFPLLKHLFLARRHWRQQLGHSHQNSAVLRQLERPAYTQAGSSSSEAEMSSCRNEGAGRVSPGKIPRTWTFAACTNLLWVCVYDGCLCVARHQYHIFKVDKRLD